MRKFFLNILVMLLSVCIFFGGVELLLWIFGVAKQDNTAFFIMTETFGRRHRAEYRDDFLLFWSLKPNIKQGWAEGTVVNTNSLGLRNEEISFDKPPDQFRIMCLGDSVTFGLGRAQDKTYPAQLQSLLDRNRPNKDIRVINGGVVGYSSFQILNYIRERGIKLKPDMITVCTAIGDAGINRFSDKEIFEKSDYAVGVKRLLHKLRFYRLLIRAIQSFASHPIEKERIVSRVALEDYVKNLAEIIQFNKQHDIETVIIQFPFRFRHKTPYFHPINITLYTHDYNLMAKRTAIKHKAHFLEIPEMQPTNEPYNQVYLYDPLHPTDAGDELIAQRLYSLLVDKKLLPE